MTTMEVTSCSYLPEHKQFPSMFLYTFISTTPRSKCLFSGNQKQYLGIKSLLLTEEMKWLHLYCDTINFTILL